MSEAVLNTNSNTINTVNIRSGPSLNSSVIRQGQEGDGVNILDQTKPAGDTHTWYKVKFGAGQNDVGWVRDDVIEVTETNPSSASTLLLFATNSKTVRVYQEDAKIQMNVYDNRAEKTELSGVWAAKIPKFDADDKWKSFIALENKYAYYIRFVPFGEIDFVISNRNDAVIILREKGFRASGREYQNS